jgi:hypothetical protein
VAAQERRLKAIETLWEQVLRLRHETSAPLFPYAILLKREYSAGIGRNQLNLAMPTSAELMQSIGLTGQ